MADLNLRHPLVRQSRAVLAILCFLPAIGTAAPLSSEVTARTDQIAARVLSESGTPSLSLAIVQKGKIVYEKAYGKARLAPPAGAQPQTRYHIGSVSKQITAAAMLLLVQDGKLSLDDPVSRFLPNLTRAREVTIRELLSHTSGYQDYYPQDYVPPFLREPVTPDRILDRWARRPLDFDPGTRWQYSNTNYVVAGQIMEQAARMPFFDFVSQRILQPLGMTSAIDLARQSAGSSDAAGYTRFALGPPRLAPEEGRGWLFAAGELAMTAHDLALWDISLLDHRLLTPQSFESMTTPVRLRNGATTDYGLGVGVSADRGHLKISHSGAVAGFVSVNTVWPDRGAAIAALANLDGSPAPASVIDQVSALLFQTEDPGAEHAARQARRIFEGLVQGRIDRTLLTPGADAFFKAEVLADAAASLKALGPLQSLKQTSVELRGGMTYRHFELIFRTKTLRLSTLAMPDGKLEQYLIQ